MSLTLQRKDELIQQHHHAYSEWNVDLYGLIASIEAESVKEINDNQEYMKSQQTVISELQTERDALAMQVAKMREALASCNYAEYRDQDHYHAVKYDFDADLIDAAKALPDNTEAIIKRHDAAVLRGAAEVCESRQTPGTGSVAILSGAADELRRMAAELEKS